jgi:hypothetical protein
MACLKVMIDLQAADIDERRTAFARLVETAQSFTQIGGTGAKNSPPTRPWRIRKHQLRQAPHCKKGRVLQTQPISR